MIPISHRRNFLFAASALAANATTPSFGQTDAGANEPVKIGIRLKPDILCPGAVLVPLEKLTFIAYHGAPEHASNRTGTCVVTFAGCLAHKFRTPGDEAFASHPVDIEKLEACQTYRVKRSSWVAAANAEFGRPKPNYKHYIFTFLGGNPGVTTRGQHFECLAQSHRVDFFGNKPFNEILDQMQMANFAAS